MICFWLHTFNTFDLSMEATSGQTKPFIAARNEGPVATVSLRREDDEGQVPTFGPHQMAGVGREAWISYLRHDDIME